MFEATFVSGGRRTSVLLPFDLDRAIADWSSLRSRMARRKPDGFTRAEWAYLIQFLQPGELKGVFLSTFGVRESPSEQRSGGALVARPGGLVSVWLPSNVSLLGPLTAVLLTLTGNSVRLKAGSRGGDLTGLFLDYCRENLTKGALRDHVQEQIVAETFTRNDPRNAEWAAASHARLVFGSDAAVAAVHALPHPLDSLGFSFGHRQSEAWLDPGACDDDALESLLRVFDVYGQAACTSPSRVVLLDAPRAFVLDVRDRLLQMWKRLFPSPPEMALASAGILDHQWALALGWDSRLADLHAAAFAVGDESLELPGGMRILCLLGMPPARALATLPSRIQTVGHAVGLRHAQDLARLLAAHGVKRFVPIADMHKFGPVWDGQPFWRDTFTLMEACV